MGVRMIPFFKIKNDIKDEHLSDQLLLFTDFGVDPHNFDKNRERCYIR